MKSISTLVQDIYSLFTKPVEPDVAVTQAFGQQLAQKILYHLNEGRGKPTLRMSNLGTPDCKLWYSINTPEIAEPLSPESRIKFLYGHILEDLLLFLARLAGHKVEGEQDEVTINGVKGHRDAIIDGRLVDVKSASPFSFRKFKDHTLKEDDSFGYISQLNAYLHSSSDDPLLVDKGKASFLAIDKTLGHICLDTYQKDKVDYSLLVKEKRAMLANTTKPPRSFSDEPEGKSGNRKLGVVCSYCPFKEACWPNLRTFMYSNKPVFLTHVERLPKVAEAK